MSQTSHIFLPPHIRVFVIIPACNEETAIANVIRDLPSALITEIVVVNNASTDNTVDVCRALGVTVLDEPTPGYGRACLKGLAYLEKKKMSDYDIVAFIDGDYSDYGEYLPMLLAPILKSEKDLVVGSRALGQREKGSMTVPQVFGNWLATRLLKVFYGIDFTDLGPFRAITWKALRTIKMKDKDFGWTVEMQLKVGKFELSYTEVPVPYRKRIGESKISGTIKGTFHAGFKIIWTIFK